MNSVLEKSHPPSTKTAQPRAFSVAGTILVLLLLVSLLLSGYLDEIGSFLRSMGASGIFLSVCMYGLLGASPVPSEPFTVLMASIYRPYLAAAIATCGNLLAALIEYYAGCCLSDILLSSQSNYHFPACLERISFDSPLFLILGRMLPGAGPKGVSLLSGAKHVPLWRYIWTTLISTMIGAVIFAFGGYGLLSSIKLLK